MTSSIVEQLADRHAISDVLVDYCRLLDRMDLVPLSDLFTADCVVEYGDHPLLRSEGAEALARSLERMWRWQRTSHHLSNISIDFLSPDEANVSSYVYAWHERSDGTTAVVMGRYIDHFVRVDTGWRIDRRRMEMNGCDAGFKVGIHPSQRNPAPPDWVAPGSDLET